MTDPVSPPTPAVVVPREPTGAMLNAACDVGPDTNQGGFSYDDAALVWSAMLAAAPTPVPGDGRGEPVAWRYRLKSPVPGEYQGWVITTDRGYAEGFCVRMGYEIQPLYTHHAPVPVEPRPSAGAYGEREAIARLIDGMAIDSNLDVYERLCGRPAALVMQNRRDDALRMADAILALRSNPPAETAEAWTRPLKDAHDSLTAYVMHWSDEAPRDYVRTLLDFVDGNLSRPALAQPAPQPVAGESIADDLVERFAVALKDKLNAASEKYGYTDGWMRDDWRDGLVADLQRHVAKGDPRDVAAYCAFAWHHHWSVAPVAGEDEVERLREAFEYVCGLLPGGPSPLEREPDTYVLTCMVNVGELKRVRDLKAALRQQGGEASTRPADVDGGV